MKAKRSIIVIVLIVIGLLALAVVQLQRRARVADIISDEARWDVLDSIAAAEQQQQQQEQEQLQMDSLSLEDTEPDEENYYEKDHHFNYRGLLLHRAVREYYRT